MNDVAEPPGGEFKRIAKFSTQHSTELGVQCARQRRSPTQNMARVSLNRAVAGMKTSSDRAGGGVLWRTREEAGNGDGEAAGWDKERIVLSDDFTAVKLHQLAIALRPLTTGGSGGRPMLTASRWEVRKAIMSLCRSQPTMCEVSSTLLIRRY